MATQTCKHCGGFKDVRNPTGNCDHLQWQIGPNDWQPIETVPKDGTEIILGMFQEQFESPIVMNSFWHNGEERGCYWFDWDGLPSPTHWMPLNRPA